MALKVNLRTLARHSEVLEGELSVTELDLGVQDEMVQLKEPLHYALEVQLMGENLLVQGSLKMALDCECVRCLKPFKYKLEVKDLALHLPLTGEEAVRVVDDSVDLTEPLREDILLAFPVHPVCDPECAGLAGKGPGVKKQSPKPEESEPSPWAELDKLKLKKN